MTHEGPLPDGSLLVGEEALLSEELSRVLSFALRFTEEAATILTPAREEDYTPEQWLALQGAKSNLQDVALDSTKARLIQRHKLS